MATHIKNLLKSFLHHDTNWQGYLIANWTTIIGNLKDHVSLEKIQDDTIILGVNNSSWMHELYMLSGMLKDKINAQLQKPYVQKIKFKFTDKKKFEEKRSYKRQESTEQVSTKITFTLRQEKALQKIQEKNKDLASSLENYFYKCNAIRKMR